MKYLSNLEDKKNYLDWLKSLKVGDEVAVNTYSRWGSNKYLIRKIVKITPTGRINLEDSTSFNPDGQQRGKSSAWDIAGELIEINDEITEYIERNKLLNNISNLLSKNDLDKLPTTHLEELEKILSWEQQKLE